MSLASIPALAVASLIPVGYLWWISRRDFFETRKVRLIQICFLWGLIAYVLAYLVQSNLVRQGMLSGTQLVLYFAPVFEELVKGAILLYLIRRPDFTYFVDGAIYGFTVGIGFAIIENIEYITGNPAAGLTLALMRVLSTNLIHATASGMIGIALGLARFERTGSARRAGILLLSILAAVGIHMGFNNVVNRNAPLLLAILLGLGGGFLIFVIMRNGLRIMKGWVDEQILQEQSVTRREASIVRKFENVDAILVDFQARFGVEKTALAREILLAQAQMGIYRKTAALHEDAKLRVAAEEKVAALRETMNENRRRMGAYRMLFLRNIFPEDASPLWGRLEDILQERMAPREQAGTGVWSRLNERVPKSDEGPGMK